MYNKKHINDLIKQIIDERGVPKNIKNSLEKAIQVLEGNGSGEEKISYIISILDESSNDPNIPLQTRTRIWNIVSVLESMSTNKTIQIA